MVYWQVRLVHVYWLVDVSSQRSNQYLIDIEFHNHVRKPPALSSLYTIPVPLPLQHPLLCYGGWGNGCCCSGLRGSQRCLYRWRKVGATWYRETFCPHYSDSKKTRVLCRLEWLWIDRIVCPECGRTCLLAHSKWFQHYYIQGKEWKPAFCKGT